MKAADKVAIINCSLSLNAKIDRALRKRAFGNKTEKKNEKTI
jgi:hypothetical protein